jgi:hypothetical protein
MVLKFSRTIFEGSGEISKNHFRGFRRNLEGVLENLRTFQSSEETKMVLQLSIRTFLVYLRTIKVPLEDWFKTRFLIV